MANESLFAFATNYAEARAKALGGNIVKGAAAFEVEDAPVRRDLSEIGQPHNNRLPQVS